MCAAPASAAYSFEWDEGAKSSAVITIDDVCYGMDGSTVCFRANGDQIWVFDSKSDGFSAVARWYTDYGRWGTCRNAHGYNTWAVCNKDFKEGYEFSFRPALYDAESDSYPDESPVVTVANT
jgi:hypothetical protein